MNTSQSLSNGVTRAWPDFAVYFHHGVLALALVGCGEAGPVCHPVRGQVVQNGRPLAEAMVVLHPANEGEVSQRPIAYADAEGEFAVTTLKSGDGAPAGRYHITVELRAPRLAGEETIRDGKNLLPARFSDPATSGLSYEVKPGDNLIPPIAVPAK
jgi:hypothetical protein